MQKHFLKPWRPSRTSLKYPSKNKIHWSYLTFAALLMNSTVLSALPAEAKACDDVHFIFARGSGESLKDVSYTAWKTEITKQLSGMTLKYSFYELGSASQSGYQYPAVSVSGDLSGFMNLLGAYIGAGQSYAFGESVRQGENELDVYTRSISRSCPRTKFILGGYSQGAMVLSQSLDDLISENIIYITTFGDPKLYLPEGKGSSGRLSKIPDACKGRNLSPYRIDVADCWAYEGVLGSIRPYQPSGYSGKIGTWCNSHDIMCSSGMSIDDHTSYISENMYADAAYKIFQKLHQVFPGQTLPNRTNANSLHDVVFLFDNTSSMGEAFAKYSSEAKKLAANVLNSGGRISLYAYGDVQEGKLPTRWCDFACSLETFSNAIDSIKPFGGSDLPESLLSAIMTAMNESAWRRNATKSIVALTDASYHDPDYDDAKTTLNDVVQRSLEIDPVNVYVITDKLMIDDYTELTSQTGGKAFNYRSSDDVLLSTTYIYERPVAKLSLENYIGLVNEEITFDASASYALDDAELTYEWDLDGDNIFEKKTSSPVISQTYTQEFSDYIQVRVSTPVRSSTMSAKVNIVSDLPTAAEIYTIDSTEFGSSAIINFTTNADQVLVMLGSDPIGFVTPVNGKGDFEINNLTDSLALTLVPYRNQVRGASRTIQLAQCKNTSSAPHMTSTPTAPDAYPTAPDTGSFTY